MQYTGSSYLVGAVVIPLPLVKHVVACGSILVALVLLPDTAPRLSSILVAWEAGAVSITGLVSGREEI